MSLLDAIRRQLLGQAAMMQPEQGMGEATQGLLGQGGQLGGGLLQSNLSQMNQGEGGLLSNIPQAALLGSAIYGQGIQGRDPFSALLPAVTQTAQLQKLMTPKTSFRQLTNVEKKAKGLPEDKEFQIGEDGKILQIGGSGTTVNVGTGDKFRIKATDEEKKMLGYDKLDDVVVTKNKDDVIIADDLRSSKDDRLGKIGDAIEKSKLLDMDMALRNIEDYVKDLQSKGFKNLPGIGTIGGRRGIATSSEGKKLRSLIATYENITLQKRSGAAVTPSEHGRIQQELGGSINTSDENVFLNILGKNRDSLETQKKNTFAIYRESDLDSYWNSGGLDYITNQLNQTPNVGISDIPTEQLLMLLKQQ
jgi:hypothetical protein